MIFDGDMAVDTVAIHPVPMPEEFARGRSITRRISVALAFDPPMRRQRPEYLAANMQLDLYRAIDVEDLIDVVTRQASGDERPPINDRRRVSKLRPGVDSFRSATLEARAWDARQLDLNDGETLPAGHHASDADPGARDGLRPLEVRRHRDHRRSGSHRYRLVLTRHAASRSTCTRAGPNLTHL